MNFKVSCSCEFVFHGEISGDDTLSLFVLRCFCYSTHRDKIISRVCCGYQQHSTYWISKKLNPFVMVLKQLQCNCLNFNKHNFEHNFTNNVHVIWQIVMYRQSIDRFWR
jgi:hypothetical protein